MRGKKEAVWAVVISAAFITAGLILSCGDDNGGNGNGEPEATWEDFCEKLVDCELVDEGVVEECVTFYEGAEEYFEEDLSDIINCTVDTRCEYLGLDCYCKIYYEKLVYCEFMAEEALIIAVPYCAIEYAEEEPFDILDGAVEVLGTSCDDLEE